MNPKKIMNIAIPVAIGAIVVTVPTVIVATEDIRHRPILPESWVDLTNPYHPAIEAVTGPITEKADYEAAVDCKEYYFDKVSKNPDIYKEDFYFGHSMYLKGISMDTGAIVKNAAAYIHDISCQKTQYQYDWVPYTGSPSYPVTIYAMSFTAEFSVTMTEVSRYLHMDDVTKVVNKGKFVVKDMPM
ncbi:MAG: hypothetical protein MJ233_04685 [Mycoplasmoidaceae bacterium]|nr:hypothetical protein [Mycoplasmoidaceae bacterium]